LSILGALPAHGFSPYLAAPSHVLEEMTCELDAVGVHGLPIEAAGMLDLSEALRVRAMLMRERIDIVHSHMFVASMFISPIARWARVPTVVETFHLREVWREHKFLKSSFWMDRQIARMVDQYIAVSRAAASHLIKRKRIARDKIRVVYNGRDLSRFRPPTEQERIQARAALQIGDAQMALVLGRLEPQKGHTYMLQALEMLATEWPRLITLFAGTGQLEADLMYMRDRAGLGDRVRFLGMVRDPMPLLAAADVVVLPSLYEGLPLVAIEALACAIAMVATSVEGTPEIILNNETGVLVPPADPSALATAIAKILGNPDWAAKLGRQGRTLVERRFDLRTQISETIELYRELIERKRVVDEHTTADYGE